MTRKHFFTLSIAIILLLCVLPSVLLAAADAVTNIGTAEGSGCGAGSKGRDRL